ncbi:tol-pal system YbgF family protein [Kitasatospora purpeofusca]|uniref:tol-pal system YbgF family protein n=1 Tax=Kitasatospora purpeofusca TaxID=67352 RepID=UPI0036655CAA
MTELFAQLLQHHGGAHARSALAAYLADDTSRCLAGPAPHRPSLELLKSAAQLTHLIAKMTSDSGEEGLALAYFRAALDLARTADDRNTYAITLRAMSMQALRLGHHRHAVDLAAAAVSVAGPDAPAPTTAFLLVQRALAHAHDHQRGSAMADLGTAELRYAQVSEDSGAFARYPRAGLAYQRGETLLALGEYPRALDAFEESARHRSELQHHPAALTRARQAETLMRLGQLEAACSHWHQFLDHYQWLHSVRADRSLTGLRRALRPYCRQREASLVLERARSLARSPASG